MRSKQVSISGKTILVEEKRIKELKKIVKDIAASAEDVWKTETKDKTSEDITSLVFDTIQDKLTALFPDLKEEDIDNAYMSEMEELINTFIDVNFSGAKKGISTLIKSVLRN